MFVVTLTPKNNGSGTQSDATYSFQVNWQISCSAQIMVAQVMPDVTYTIGSGVYATGLQSFAFIQTPDCGQNLAYSLVAAD